MSQPRLTKLPHVQHCHRALGWRDAALGMTIKDLLALGVSHEKIYAYQSTGFIAFDKPLPPRRSRRRGHELPLLAAAAPAPPPPPASPPVASSPRVAPRYPRGIPCLRCRRPFLSEGPHNRMCVYCRTESASPFEPNG